LRSASPPQLAELALSKSNCSCEKVISSIILPHKIYLISLTKWSKKRLHLRGGTIGTAETAQTFFK
jgi:hypothetical protein